MYDFYSKFYKVTVSELEKLLKYLPRQMLVMVPLADVDCFITVSKEKTQVTQLRLGEKIENVLIMLPEKCSTEIVEDQKAIARTCLKDHTNDN